MDIIYCLVGRSGSGKTTVARALAKDYNVIQSYTTRPPRSENEWGHTFVKGKPEKMVAHNVFNGYDYWMTEEQFKNKGKSIYVVDPEGARQLKESGLNVVVIYFSLMETEAMKRMLKERSFKEAQERIEHDREIFSRVRADHVINANCTKDELIRRVKEIMGGVSSTKE